MDESAINKLGLAPLKPYVDEIVGLTSVNDLPALLARFHMEMGEPPLLFGNQRPFFTFWSNQDFANSDSVIAFVDVGGLGLQDRDYYTAPR